MRPKPFIIIIIITPISHFYKHCILTRCITQSCEIKTPQGPKPGPCTWVTRALANLQTTRPVLLCHHTVCFTFRNTVRAFEMPFTLPLIWQTIQSHKVFHSLCAFQDPLSFKTQEYGHFRYSEKLGLAAGSRGERVNMQLDSRSKHLLITHLKQNTLRSKRDGNH